MALDLSTSFPGQLESRLTESMFRRFEPLIAQAVNAFPAETSFTVPPDISPTTFVARFRDARFSYLKFDWPSKTINRDKLLSIQGKHTISLDPATGLVWFRAKQRRGRPTEFVTEAQVHTSSGEVVWPDFTPQELQAVALLLNNKRITGPIRISGKVPDDITADLISSFDVSVVYHEHNNQTIML